MDKKLSLGGAVALAEVAPEPLRDRYEIRGEEILAYLQGNSSLVPILVDIADTIPPYFGPDVTLALALVDDPEGDEGGEPFVFVRTRLPPADALARLRRFDEGWWLRVMASRATQVTVTLEYA